MAGKADVKGSAVPERGPQRWIPAQIAMRITGHGSRETLRKAAKYKKKFGYKKHPGTGELEYDLDGCLAYAGKTEADVVELLDAREAA